MKGYDGPIDIVFTVWKPTATTYGAFSQLVRNTRQPFNVMVMSTDGSVAQNANLAFERCKSPIVASVDDDAYVPDGWLTDLVKVLEAQPNAAAVGPKVLGPAGLPLVNSCASLGPIEIRRVFPHFIGGCCFVMRNDLGYRYCEDFLGSGWEDTDLFRQMHEAGHTLWHYGGVEVHHASRRLNNAPHYKDNCIKFHERWPVPSCMCCETEQDLERILEAL